MANGIKPTSASVELLDSDLAPQKTVVGFVVGEQIVCELGTPGTNYEWKFTKPSASNYLVTGIGDLAAAQVAFTPDVAGAYRLDLTCDGEPFWLIMGVDDPLPLAPRRTITLLKRPNASIATPTDGWAVFGSEEFNAPATRDEDGNYRVLGSGSVAGTLATTSAIATLDPTGHTDGTRWWITSLRCPATLRTTADAPVAGERWATATAERVLERCDPAAGRANPWLPQGCLWIDAVAGDDEATGADTAHPIKTADEAVRRLRGAVYSEPFGLIIKSASVDNLTLDIEFGDANDDGYFYVDATPGRAELATGTITAITTGAWYSTITVSGIADLTPYLNAQLRVTSGDNEGAICRISVVNPAGGGLNTALVSWFGVPNDPRAGGHWAVVSAWVDPYSQHPPAPTDTFVIEAEVLCNFLSVSATGGAYGVRSVCVQGLDCYSVASSLRANVGRCIILVGCATKQVTGQVGLYGCLVYSGGADCAIAAIGADGIGLYDSLLAKRNAEATTAAIWTDCYFSRCVVGSMGMSTVTGAHAALESVHIVAAPADGITIAGASTLRFGTITGSGVVGYGIACKSGGIGIYTTTKPAITGTAGAFKLVGSGYASWGSAPLFDAVHNCGLIDAASTESRLDRPALATIAAIATLDPTGYPDGTRWWITTLRCHATLRTTADAAVAMERWATATAGRVLERENAPQGAWSALTTIYINPSTGDDEAAGDEAHPLATFPEVCRRFRGWEVAAPVTIYPMDDGVELVGQIVCAAEAQIIVDGQPGIDADPARTLVTGAVATFTQYSEVTNEVDLITVTGIADWTPYVGKRIRVTSGTRQHYVLMVGEANPDGLGNNVARVTQLDKAFGLYQILQVGDVVAVEELVAVSKYEFTVQRPARWDATTDGSYYHLIVQSLSMDAGTGVPLNLQAPGAVRYSQPLFFGCILRPRGAIEGCALWSCCVLLDGAIYLKGGNGVIFATCLFLGISGTPSIYMTDLCAIQYSVVQGAGMQAGRGHSSIYGPGTGIFDAPGTAILIDHNSRLEFRNGVCLGKGNVGFGLYLGHGDCVANYSGYKPMVTGTAGDWCYPDAVQKDWVDAPEFSTTYASGIVGG